MRVLQVMKSMGVGGAETLVRTLSEELDRRGHEVAVASMPGPLLDTFTLPWYEIPLSGSHPKLVASSAWGLSKVIHEFRPDVVHAHNPGILATVGAATLRGRRVPALATFHGSPFEAYRNNVRLAKVAGLPIYACGPAVAVLMEEAGHPVDGTVINGVTTHATKDRATMRAELGIAPDTFVVAQVARFMDQKRPDRAVEAMAQVDDALLLLVGDGVLRPDVERRAAELGLGEDRVRLLGRRPDAHDIMVAADAVMLSSDFEGLPLTLLEAMRLGRPVIGTRVSGIQELIQDGVDGVLADPDPTSLAAAIVRLRDDVAGRERMGAQALARSAEFTAEEMTNGYERIYTALKR